MEIGFSTEKYLKVQKKAIEERLSKFEGRLYLEFGGKLIDDFHASRTLPGYDPNAKLKLLKSLNRDLGIIYCISARQLDSGKIRGDLGVGYDLATIKALEDLKINGLRVEGVVVNRYNNQKAADIFIRRIKQMGIPVCKRGEIEGYPSNVETALSSKGYGADEYLAVKKKLIVVWGAGPGSGKLSTCLGQIYHESREGLNSGYAKFETFPVWDLPLSHPVNVAYEAATADLGDFNMIDSFHFKAYRKKVVNYNRDVEAFPIIQQMFRGILGKSNFTYNYKSPTDMGFNCLAQGIINHKVVEQAARKEAVFYLFRYREEYKQGLVDKDTLKRMDKILERLGIGEEFLPTVDAARLAVSEKRPCGAAIELKNGTVVNGKSSKLLHAEAAVILNAIKEIAGIDDKFNLISPSVIGEINRLNRKLSGKTGSLDAAESVLAWAVSSRDNPLAKSALKQIGKLQGCYIHTTHKPSAADLALFRKLGLWCSTDGKVN